METHDRHDISISIKRPNGDPDDGDDPEDPGDGDPDDDDKWAFTAWTANGCSGNATNPQGSGPTVQCQVFDKPYNSTTTFLLPESLKLCFYNQNNCNGQVTEVTDPTNCVNLPSSSSYRILTDTTACQLS
ncbi:hypothetical protein F4777DRAFT_564118 [Nemania sp. FL0916]|nr:hypothetical protein F4777DRAFT_564118 [Nemania sp. FL0916]